MTAIEWTDKTWNPTVGCRRVSPGCENCYAERVAHRGLSPEHKGLTVVGSGGIRWTGEVRCLPERLAEPLHWRKPRRVFVNSMSDLFHEDVPDEFIAAVFDIARQCMNQRRGHVFQILTKRAERMRDVMVRLRFDRDRPEGKMVYVAESPDSPGYCLGHGHRGCTGLTNVWLGVSCEDQKRADERIPLLLQCPAAVRFVSAEPLLGPIDLHAIQIPGERDGLRFSALTTAHGDRFGSSDTTLDWIIVGGESGPGARNFHLDWARSIVRQCKDAGVSCFVKQLGAHATDHDPSAGRSDEWPEGFNRPVRLLDRKGGAMEEWPEYLRVREFPRAAR